MSSIVLSTELPGPRSRALAERKKAIVADGVSLILPVFIESAHGALMTDVDGNTLIDMGSGIGVLAVGNTNDKVVEAVTKQVSTLIHTCFTLTPYKGYVELAELLARVAPGDFEKRVLFLNSGAEAIENAVKIARRYTGRDAIVAFDNAFHGRTALTMAMTTKQNPYKSGFGPFAPEVYRVHGSYPFRDGLSGEEAAARTIAEIETTIGAENLAALVIEPLQGEGGFIVPASGFLPTLLDWAHANDVVFIADEVQSGFARTGDMFACEHEGVVPDMMTVAKGIGGGMPISGVVGRADIMNAAQPGGLGGTFAGSPVSCAAALVAVQQMLDEDYPGKARRIGELMGTRLRAAAAADTRIGEVRGRGAMMAVEFVLPGTTTPDPRAADAVLGYLHSHGVVAVECGTDGNVIRFLPPLVITDDQLAEAFDVFDAALAATR